MGRPSKYKFQCKHCSKRYATPLELARHSRSEHSLIHKRNKAKQVKVTAELATAEPISHLLPPVEEPHAASEASFHSGFTAGYLTAHTEGSIQRTSEASGIPIEILTSWLIESLRSTQGRKVGRSKK